MTKLTRRKSTHLPLPHHHTGSVHLPYAAEGQILPNKSEWEKRMYALIPSLRSSYRFCNSSDRFLEQLAKIHKICFFLSTQPAVSLVASAPPSKKSGNTAFFILHLSDLQGIIVSAQLREKESLQQAEPLIKSFLIYSQQENQIDRTLLREHNGFGNIPMSHTLSLYTIGSGYT